LTSSAQHKKTAVVGNTSRGKGYRQCLAAQVSQLSFFFNVQQTAINVQQTAFIVGFGEQSKLCLELFQALLQALVGSCWSQQEHCRLEGWW
jgi:hypothetical protein